MIEERQVRLFRNGRNQALRIPRDFELPGNEAMIHTDGERLIVEPLRKPSLLTVLATLRAIPYRFPYVDERIAPLGDVAL